MRIEKMTRKGKVFAVIPVEDLQRLMDDAEMLADVRAYDAAKGRLAGESPVRIWRDHRALTQETLAKVSKVSRGMIAAIEAGHKTGGIATLKKLAAGLKVDLENLA